MRLDESIINDLRDELADCRKSNEDLLNELAMKDRKMKNIPVAVCLDDGIYVKVSSIEVVTDNWNSVAHERGLLITVNGKQYVSKNYKYREFLELIGWSG